jgi:glucose/mannose transport system substrate-binding protein
VLAGNPPSVVQMKGPNIKDWAGQGALNDIDEVAKAENWDNLLPPLLKDVVTYDGKYFAAPANIHRVNWIWANPQVLEKAGIAMPTTWDEFNAAADKLKAAGITPLAHGGQPWQDATVFETVVLGIGGPDFYHKAFVELDDATLRSATMVKAFDEMRKLRGYVDEGFSNREWNLATGMVMNGQAGFQIMGDWAKGEFTAAGLTPGKDYGCTVLSDHGMAYVMGGDVFAFPRLKDANQIKAQQLLARVLLEPATQIAFAQKKGSIPVRLDLDTSSLDVCARKAAGWIADPNAQVPANEMLSPPALTGAMEDIISQYWNDPAMTPDAFVGRVASMLSQQF